MREEVLTLGFQPNERIGWKDGWVEEWMEGGKRILQQPEIEHNNYVSQITMAENK